MTRRTRSGRGSTCTAPLEFRRPLDAAIRWLGPAQVTVEECLAVAPRGRGPEAKKLGDAMALLRELLGAGPVRTSEVMAQARRQGVSARTLRRATRQLGVVANLVSPTGPWEWALPEPDDPDGQANMLAGGHLGR